jgi:hypothetical protein
MLLGLRVRRAHLQTAARTLHRRQDRRTITLVGTCHIGEERYFQELAEHVCGLEDKGALVHCEGAHPDQPDPNAPALTPEQKAARELWNRADQVTTHRIREVLGWTRQKLVLTRATWLDLDMSMDQVQRESDGEEIRQFAEARLTKLYWPEGDTIGPLRFHVETSDFLRRTATRLPWVQRRINAGLPAVMVHRRRQVAVTHALTAIGQGRDVVMVWGAGHQPAMVSDLAAHGFRPTGPVTWHTVGKLLTWWQRAEYVLRVRDADHNNTDQAPTASAVGITAPVPGWAYEMNEPEPSEQPTAGILAVATAGGGTDSSLPTRSRPEQTTSAPTSSGRAASGDPGTEVPR